MKHKISIASSLLLLGFVFSSQLSCVKTTWAVTRESVKSKPEKITDYCYCYSWVERHWFVLEVDYKTPLEALIQSCIDMADSRITTANFPNPKPGPSRAGYILVEFENHPVTCGEARRVLKAEGYILANLWELIAFTKCGLVSPYPVVAWCDKQSRDHVLVLHSYCSSPGTIRHFLQLASISRRFESAYFLVRVPMKHQIVTEKCPR